VDVCESSLTRVPQLKVRLKKLEHDGFYDDKLQNNLRDLRYVVSETSIGIIEYSRNTWRNSRNY